MDARYTGDVAERDAAVATRAKAFLDSALAVPAVDMVITRGPSDRYSWWRDPSILAHYGLDREPRPLPFDDALRRKPMADAFVGRRPTHRAASLEAKSSATEDQPNAAASQF